MNPLELLSIVNKIKPILNSPNCRKTIEHQDGIVSLVVTAYDEDIPPAAMVEIDKIVARGGYL
jgi:hypothetical protein